MCSWPTQNTDPLVGVGADDAELVLLLAVTSAWSGPRRDRA
ncbi:MAG TPA: hypothetical protein VF063_05000 [Gaiellaceae bacterium]